jgi:hypothetical protein|tara:strand:+ start:158 stop:337 length:180 start_codon:yes stop_codon:yes gene_type:complete
MPQISREELTQIRKDDQDMESFLHDMANKSDDEFVMRLAERFSKLTRKAHDRLHWTGAE